MALKSVMLEWVNKCTIEFESDMKQAELMEIINQHKPRPTKHVIDESQLTGMATQLFPASNAI